MFLQNTLNGDCLLSQLDEHEMSTELANVVQSGAESHNLATHVGLQIAEIDADVTRHGAGVVVDGKNAIFGSLLVGLLGGGFCLGFLLAHELGGFVLLDLFLVLLALGLAFDLACLATADGLAVPVQREVLGGGAGVRGAAPHLTPQKTQRTVSGTRAVAVSGSPVPAVQRITVGAVEGGD
jgi:hypothetical protein